MTDLRISAKTLGELALPGFCPRCFWLKLRGIPGTHTMIPPCLCRHGRQEGSA